MWDEAMRKNLRNFHKEWHEKIEEMQRLGGLRIWILHVLDEYGPINGVEIMDAIQEHHNNLELQIPLRSRGHRPSRPSPGSVYPMLKKMVEEGLIIKREDGKYELTDRGGRIVSKLEGRTKYFQEAQRGIVSVDTALNEIDTYLTYLEDIKSSKLDPHKEWIEELSVRLKKIENSLQKPDEEGMP